MKRYPCSCPADRTWHSQPETVLRGHPAVWVQARRRFHRYGDTVVWHWDDIPPHRLTSNTIGSILDTYIEGDTE